MSNTPANFENRQIAELDIGARWRRVLVAFNLVEGLPPVAIEAHQPRKLEAAAPQPADSGQPTHATMQRMANEALRQSAGFNEFDPGAELSYDPDELRTYINALHESAIISNN